MKTMRRKDKEIAADEAVKLLAEGEYGILSTVNDAGQPYGIPLNYVYKDHHSYFHSALTGPIEALPPLKTKPPDRNSAARRCRGRPHPVGPEASGQHQRPTGPRRLGRIFGLDRVLTFNRGHP